MAETGGQRGVVRDLTQKMQPEVSLPRNPIHKTMASIPFEDQTSLDRKN